MGEWARCPVLVLSWRRMWSMPMTYESCLVLLSVVMAIQGAYVGLRLAVQISAAAGMRRRLLAPSVE